ncbi:MAG: type II toxin-antitoxin system RelE/ParE family toxin [Aquisalinus sp.]|nr:type II toxin-antitoxin system RelE/ParE family toxin [Aquisalinus sp.]
MALYSLSQKADNDLASLLRYSYQEYGEERTDNYLMGLMEAFDSIGNFPNLGGDASYIRSGLRKYVSQRHTIYYRRQEDGARIIRILGPGQDAETHLANES